MNDHDPDIPEHDEPIGDAPDFSGPPPSVIFGFWPDASPPSEEEVRLAVRNAFPDLTFIGEPDGDDEALWAFGVAVPGLPNPLMVWLEDRGDLSADAVEESLDDPVERREAGRSQWLIGTETYLGEAPAKGFQIQMRVLDAAIVSGMPAAFDDSALSIRSGKIIREIARSKTPPRAGVLFGIHETPVEGEKVWVHTHGLGRFGLPEIEVVGLGKERSRDAFDLVDAVADALVSGSGPTPDGLLALGDGIEVVLVTPEDALMRLGAGGELRDAGQDDHIGHSLALVDTEGQPPYAALDHFAECPVLFKGRLESDRQARLAKERYGVFGQLFAIHRREGWRFHVKLCFEGLGDPPSYEHLWFEVRELKPGRIKGVCLNEPMMTRDARQGEVAWHDYARLSDWNIVTPGGNYDPESAGVLLHDS